MEEFIYLYIDICKWQFDLIEYRIWFRGDTKTTAKLKANGKREMAIALLSHLLFLYFHQGLMDKVHLKISALHFDCNKSVSVICSWDRNMF